MTSRAGNGSIRI